MISKHNNEEVRELLANKYDLYEIMDILELGPDEFLYLISEYIEENLEDINDRLQDK